MRTLMWCALVTLGCPGIFKSDDTGTDTSSDADTDSDTDSDTDTDTDSDTDADTDADTDTDIDCDEDLAGVQEGPDCITATLSCGSSIQDSTEDGTTSADGASYVGWFCAPVSSAAYTGPERVYRFDHPGDNQTATIALSSPCGELDLFAAFWEEDVCPTVDNSTSECDGDDSSGDGQLDIWNPTPRSYLIYVDGPTGDEVNFELSISCG